jgi:AcrR family transcriptional regulator
MDDRPTHPNENRRKAAPSGNSARQRIITDARRHFFAHGFKGVTTDDLATALGMSKKTLYAHFPSKTALLEAVLLDKFREVNADLSGVAVGASLGFAASLQQLLACMQRHMEEIQPPFIRDIRREAPDMFKLVETRRAEIIQRYFGKLLSEGRRTGLIRKDVPVNFILEILLEAVQAIVNPQRMEELGLMPKQGLFMIIKIVLEGAITEKGRQKL